MAYRKSLNKEVLQNVRRILEEHFQSPDDGVVLPVMVANDRVYHRSNIVRSASSSTQGSTTTIYAVPAGQEFLLNNLVLTLGKSAINDVVQCSISATIDGVSRTLAIIDTGTNAAATGIEVLSLPTAIKIDAGTNIVLNVGAGTTVTNVSGIVYGTLRPLI